VTPSDVLAACKLSEGELDLFDGSPPCQTFSTAGKRNMQDDRTDLFMEYARLVQGIQPKVFVAENVSGMVKGVAKGQFKITLQILRDCGYRVECRLLDAQWLGVPQQRQRVIFIGMRNDLELDPVFPKPLTYRYSVRDACAMIDVVKQSVFYGTDQRTSGDGPCPTIRAAGGVGAALGKQWWCETSEGRRKFTIAELKRIGAFPDDFELVGSYAKQWARVGNSVPPLMMRAVAEQVRDSLTSASHGHDTRE
jgi:DNA (cytosine-5)-methyltransferase 1